MLSRKSRIPVVHFMNIDVDARLVGSVVVERGLTGRHAEYEVGDEHSEGCEPQTYNEEASVEA